MKGRLVKLVDGIHADTQLFNAPSHHVTVTIASSFMQSVAGLRCELVGKEGVYRTCRGRLVSAASCSERLSPERSPCTRHVMLFTLKTEPVSFLVSPNRHCMLLSKSELSCCLAEHVFGFFVSLLRSETSAKDGELWRPETPRRNADDKQKCGCKIRKQMHLQLGRSARKAVEVGSCK